MEELETKKGETSKKKKSQFPLIVNLIKPIRLKTNSLSLPTCEKGELERLLALTQH